MKQIRALETVTNDTIFILNWLLEIHDCFFSNKSVPLECESGWGHLHQLYPLFLCFCLSMIRYNHVNLNSCQLWCARSNSKCLRNIHIKMSNIPNRHIQCVPFITRGTVSSMTIGGSSNNC